MLTAALGFLACLILILLRVPIAIAMGCVGFVGFGYLVDWMPAMGMVAYATRDGAMGYGLIVIPLFILMGNLVAGTGISTELFRSAQRWLGARRGGLADATVLAAAGFGSICGSSVATVATIGKVAIPAMREHRYDDSLSGATIAAGATLGILIPPSVLMVVYGIITETHIGKLYAAGLIPGVIGVLGYLIAVRWSVTRKPGLAPAAESSTWSERIRSLGRIWPAALLFIVVIGGMYAGVFTAIEAAGVGAFGGLVLALLRRNITLGKLYDIFLDSARTSVALFALIIGASVFTEFLNYTGVHHSLLSFVSESGFSPVMVVLIISIIYIMLGMMMETMSMVLLTVPLFFPIVIGLGYDPVWFGVLVVVLCELGLITPPVGINLFVMQSVAPGMQLGRMMRAIVPFICMDIVRVGLIAFIPALSLFLPELLFD